MANSSFGRLSRLVSQSFIWSSSLSTLRFAVPKTHHLRTFAAASKPAAALQDLFGVPEIARTQALKEISAHIKQHDLQADSGCMSQVVGANLMTKDIPKVNGTHIVIKGRHMRESVLSLLNPNQLNKCYGGIPRHPCLTRSLASSSDSQSSRRTKQQKQRKAISTVDDPFDALTDNIPEKPVTFTEGASYSLVILAGLGVAAVAGYAVFKELIFQPKEYKVYGKALERVQDDSQVRSRIGSPITGYGQESRNRAARQRIPNRKWTDEDGVERVEVNFYIRGPHGAGKVFTEMFKDKAEKQWKFTYLIVEIKSPSPAQLMLESYVPALSG